MLSVRKYSKTANNIPSNLVTTVYPYRNHISVGEIMKKVLSFPEEKKK